MIIPYAKAKPQIQTLHNAEYELPWLLLTLDLMVIVAAIGFGLGVML